MQSDTQTGVALYGSALPTTELRRAVTDGRVPVAVYGLGKMGLPLAAVLADVTGNTVGVDIDPAVTAAVNEGRCPVEREPGLEETVAQAVEEGALVATTDGASAAAKARVHVVIVPTLVENDEPDLSNLRAVLDDIAAGLSDGDLVCIESTVPPGTSRDVVAPQLATASGDAVTEYGIAFCPERTSSGRALEDIRGAYPKVVGGVDEESTEAARVLYDQVTSNAVHAVSDATTAECVKVFEGVYRDVNIALANELARLADELSMDVTEAIDVANTQPYCDIHDPGPGVGGHCIPYYPYFLIETLDTETPLMRTARRVNDGMPLHTVELLLDELREAGHEPTDCSVAVLGIAYRSGVDETCESPGLDIVHLLQQFGTDVTVVDPVVDTEAFDAESRAIDDLEESSFDAAVLVTDHDAFDDVPWAAFEDAVIVDGRAVLDPDRIPGPVHTVGVGTEPPD